MSPEGRGEEMSTIFYLCIFLMAMLLAWLADRKKSRVLLFLLIILLTFAAGLRGRQVGIDTPGYYENIEAGFPYAWKFREEGFRAVSNLIFRLTGNAQLVFVLCALVTNYCILERFWDYRKEASFSFMTLLYLLIYYSSSMNIMRQYVAVALVFYATRFLPRKKHLWFAGFLLVAVSFHRSALLAIVLPALQIWNGLSRKKKKLLAIPFLLSALICASYLYFYLKSDVSAYASQTVDNVNITYFYRLSVFLFAWYTFSHKIYIKIGGVPKTGRFGTMEKVVPLCCLAGLGFESLSMFFAFVGRTGLFFSMFEPVFWGIAVKKSKNRELYALLILIYAGYMLLQVVIRNSGGIMPYSIYLNW